MTARRKPIRRGMGARDDLRNAVQATRLQAKSARNMLRTLTQMLADLERLLEELDAEPMEAERYDGHLADSRHDNGGGAAEIHYATGFRNFPR